MRVTRIERQKRHRGRTNLFVDGEFALGISDETLLRAGIRTGDEIDPSALRQLEQDEQRFAVRTAATRLLSHRARTVKELGDRLRRKGFAPELIEPVVNDLQRSGVLDDRAFARMYVRDQLTLHPTGRHLLSGKLKRMGVEPGIVAEVLEETLSPHAEEGAAEMAAQKFLRTRARRIADPSSLRSRLTGFLTRRGFPREMIRPIVNRITKERFRPAE